MTSPFDEAKYRALLKGLEAVEILLSEAQTDNDTRRLDNGYFTKDYLKLKYLSKRWGSLDDYAKQVVCGPFGSTILNDSYVENGTPMIRPFNIRRMETDHENIAYLREVDIAEKGLKVFDQDTLLFARVGEVGCGILTFDRATISPNIIAVQLKNVECNPYYAAVFFNTHYGRLQMEGAVKAVAQPTISTNSIRDLKIPKPSAIFSKKIETFFKESLKQNITGYDLYSKAEQTLLRTLGLENWQPPEALTYERKSSNVFASGRFDAEHFQPKYDHLYRQIKKSGIETRSLGEIILPVMNGFDCRDFVDEGTPYIRVGDVKKGRIDLDSAFRIPLTADEIGKDISLQIGDVLFTRKGSFGNAAPVWNETKHAVISSEIMLLRLRSEYKANVLPEYLALFLNSIAGNIQAEKWAHGAAFYSITQEDLGSFVIPLISKSEQESLCNLIMQSEAARKQAHNLLESAKRAVEIAIEENETVAMAFLKQSQG